MEIKTYRDAGYHNSFKRYLIVADSLDQAEEFYEFMRTLPFIDTVDYVSAGLGLYFARDEDRTFFLMTYNKNKAI